MKQHKVAVVGCGSMAATWVEYAVQRPDVKLLSLTDVNPEATKAMAQRFDLDVKQYTKVEQALGDEPTLLFDLTVPTAHYAVSAAAMNAGVDVFTEKPIADNFDAALQLVATAKATGRTYSVMQNRRFLRQLRDIRAYLDTGAIGQPTIVTADFFIGPHFGGFRDQMASPLLIDMSIHTMDQCRYLTGADPVSVTCHEFNPAGSWYKGNCAAICTFEMSDGSVYSYRGCWCAEGIHTSWQSQWRLVCPQGSIQWDGLGEPQLGVPVRPEPFELLNDCAARPIPRLYQGREEHFGCLDELFAAYEEGRPAQTNCFDNIKSVVMAFAAVKSAREQRKVMISEMLKEGTV